MGEPPGGEIQRGNEYRVGRLETDDARVGRLETRDIDATTLELIEELGRRFQVGAVLAFVKLNFRTAASSSPGSTGA